MAKLTTSPIGSFSQASLTTLNTNFDAIETALENTLSRDGTIPNQMTADLDMNENSVLNVDTLDTDVLIVGGVDFTEAIDALEFGLDDLVAAVDAAELARDIAVAAANSINYVTNKTQLLAALTSQVSFNVTSAFTSVTLSSTAEWDLFRLWAHLGSWPQTFTVTLPSGVQDVSSGDIMSISANCANLKIVGAPTVDLTMTSVASISGTAGAWVVTYNVSSSTGVGVGDVLKNFQIGPIPIVNGDNAASYVLRNRPLANELYNPVVNLGRITAAAGAGSASFAGGLDTTANCLVVGDLLTVAGQTRPIASIAAGSCTITGTWDVIGGVAEDLYLVTKPNTGTVTITGTAVVGVGTLFLTEANVGDMILVDGSLVEITAITDNLNMTLNVGHTTGAGTPFSIITNGCLHDGAHVVSAVGAGTVTVTNRNRTKPPINKVVGGSMHAIKTVLRQLGTGDGLVFKQSAALSWIDKIAILGPRSGGGIGVAMGGRVPTSPLAIDGVTSFGTFTQHGYVSEMLTGPDFAVVEFAYNATVGHGCNLQARNAAFSGGTIVNVWAMEGGLVNLRRAVLSGGYPAPLQTNTPSGLLLNSGGVALITEALFVGNLGDGYRAEGGAVGYGETPRAVANGVMAFRSNDKSTLSISQPVILLSGGSGFYYADGGGKVSAAIVGANRSAGFDVQGPGGATGTGCWITGNVANGINARNGQISMSSSWIVGNKNIGVYALDNGEVRIPSCFVTGNIAANVRADNGSFIAITNGYSPTLYVTGAQSRIDRTGTVNTPTLSGVGRLNEYTKDGSIIHDASSATGWNTTGLRPNGGANLTFIGRSSAAQDCGNVPANQQLALPADITITGAATTGMVAMVNSNVVDAGLSFTAKIVAADTVRVYVQNHTGSAIDPPNATYTVVVLGVIA